jgi:hypothetical protein
MINHLHPVPGRNRLHCAVAASSRTGPILSLPRTHMSRPFRRLPSAVCLGVGHPSGAHDHIVITVGHLRFSFYGATSLTRERVCNLLVQLLLRLASAVTLGSQGRRTVPISYCSLETPLIWTARYTQGTGFRHTEPKRRY